MSRLQISSQSLHRESGPNRIDCFVASPPAFRRAGLLAMTCLQLVMRIGRDRGDDCICGQFALPAPPAGCTGGPPQQVVTGPGKNTSPWGEIGRPSVYWTSSETACMKPKEDRLLLWNHGMPLYAWGKTKTRKLCGMKPALSLYIISGRPPYSTS